MRVPVILCFVVVGAFSVPIPEDSSTTSTEESISSSSSTEASSTTEESYSPPQLKVIDEKPDETAAASDIIGDEHNHEKRHRPTPSTEELEDRRQAFIKALGGGQDEDGGGGGGVLTAGLSGLGSLATDAVTLLTANANETFAPLREATQKAKESFPNVGTTLNNFVKNGRNYATRAYRGVAKNLRIKLTNTLRFMLAGVTRLASTVAGLYSVLVSLLDVATRGLTAGAGVGARLLSGTANRTVQALATGTSLLQRLTSSGVLKKPYTQALGVSDTFFKGVSEDLYDKFEWTNEGILSKVNLAQAIAPNFLLYAHENANMNGAAGGGDPEGGYSIHGGDDDPTLLSLASNAAELMLRGERNSDDANSTTTESDKRTTEPDKSSTTESSTTEGSAKMSERSDNSTSAHPQELLNDIFGLQMEINDLKNNTSNDSKT